MTWFLKLSAAIQWVLLWTTIFMVWWFNLRLFSQLLKRFNAFYDSILLSYTDHFRELHHFTLFRDYQSEKMNNQFLIIICLIFVSPECVGRVFDDSPVFHEQLICVIKAFLRIQSNRIFLLYLLWNTTLIR